ncbi:sensor histidine kinase [Sphingomonas sp. CARO-RG-8B-R24-01]|uniref:sensor histidine kinase n=1 Tax=Sphingomonas sp. CARO-RG-8B-R24-01 TaxID=2914831 RepID=UPI001F55C1F5|nr:sensor histidine kinase [Sphingomonas sp. CARO-RG-8B-R24-01]
MASRILRLFVGTILAILFVTVVVTCCTLAAPNNAAPTFGMVCLAFAIIAFLGGRFPTSIAVAAGALELAFILPGEGFAVSDPDHAMGLIAVIATGVMMAWYVGRRDTLSALQAAEVATSRQIAEWRGVAHSELSHRLSNDLSIMVSMASIKAREATSPEARDALADLSGRLIVLGRVYQRLDLRDLDSEDAVAARQFLFDLCDDLQLSTLSEGSISLRVDIDDALRLPIRTLSMLGLIANEMLTNVRKHAFPDGNGGEVLLYLHKHAFRTDCVEMIVTDNGAGFSSGPTNAQRRGRSLLSMLASQIDGSIAYARISGTTVATLQFALPASARGPAGAEQDTASRGGIAAERQGAEAHRHGVDPA